MRKFLNSVILILVFTGQALACDVKPYFSPPDNVRWIILTELDKAKDTVDVAAYAFTDPMVAEKLAALARRGVKVVVYMDRVQSRNRYSKGRYLAASGVEVHIKKRRYLQHNKYMIIDGSEVLTGSYNFSGSAAKQDNNFEVIADCPDVVGRFKDDFKRLLKGGD